MSSDFQLPNKIDPKAALLIIILIASLAFALVGDHACFNHPPRGIGERVMVILTVLYYRFFDNRLLSFLASSLTYSFILAGTALSVWIFFGKNIAVRLQVKQMIRAKQLEKKYHNEFNDDTM